MKRERERRHDGVWRSGVKENRVWKAWRETLEWRSAENHPRIIQHIKRLALKFWSQHFYSLDLQLYCWVAEDSSALCAYSALFYCCLSSCISDGCRCNACSLKRWKLSKCLGAAVSTQVLLKSAIGTHSVKTFSPLTQPAALRWQFGRKSRALSQNPSKYLSTVGTNVFIFINRLKKH